MITVQQAQDLAGAIAYDQGGQKVGNVAEIYYDRSTGEPEWLTVKTGLFGLKESFVPLTLARPRGQQEVEFATGQSRRAEDRRAAGRAGWKAVVACEGLLVQGASSLAALLTATALERQSAG
jgi:PRC-barrel domain